MVRAQLDYGEAFAAAQVGVRRRLFAIFNGQKDSNGAEAMDERQKWGADIVGAMSECVVAKAAGLYWPGSVNAKKEDPDIPPDIGQARD